MVTTSGSCSSIYQCKAVAKVIVLLASFARRMHVRALSDCACVGTVRLHAPTRPCDTCTRTRDIVLIKYDGHVVCCESDLRPAAIASMCERICYLFVCEQR